MRGDNLKNDDKGVSSRGRTTVRGASLEVLLIVIGVLIALGVDAGVGTVRDARLEQEYLRALQADLSDDLMGLDQALEELDTRDRAASYLREAISGTSSELADGRFFRSLDRAGYYATFRPRRAAIDDLLGSGNLRMLSNLDLRLRLLRYHESAADRAPYDEWGRDLIWNGFRPERGLYPFVLTPDNEGVEEGFGPIMLDDLALDPTFRQGLSNVEALVGWQRDWYQDLRRTLVELITLLDEEIGEPARSTS